MTNRKDEMLSAHRTRALEARGMFVFIGAQPRTEWSMPSSGLASPGGRAR